MSHANNLQQPRPAGLGKPSANSSRLTLLSDGVSAFAARAGSARAACHGLDLQYYMWKADLTGQLLAREALLAADRGVRVRILLDDMHGLGQERTLAPLIGHPLIELRRFNGTRWRRWGRVAMLLEMLVGSWHLNRRMHNKAWIVDDGLVICGGRNIGDSYFDASDEFNFRDLDVVIRGAAALSASAVFEGFWTNLSCPRLSGTPLCPRSPPW